MAKGGTEEMKLYWPVAEYEAEYMDSFGNRLWTYDGSLSMKKAEEVILAWKKSGYNITKAFVDITDGDRTERIEVKI